MRLLKLEIAKRHEQVVPGHYEPEGARPFEQHWVREYTKVWYESSIQVVVSGYTVMANVQHDQFEAEFGPLKEPRYQDMIAHRLRRMVMAEIEKHIFEGA
ncbi:hypothetical protein [Paraburkholderia youngii]|uniref:Uncharacterized protein n=1 Tax=Paraburkholderia youngii TaxID=2782701 RepID=A0A7Y6JVM8_9BURK|nr:hypothetical protein [Paraburkholderia youngii]NUX98769.1 hypothetical protein [Paraburkholderia youngii]